MAPRVAVLGEISERGVSCWAREGLWVSLGSSDGLGGRGGHLPQGPRGRQRVSTRDLRSLRVLGHV